MFVRSPKFIYCKRLMRTQESAQEIPIIDVELEHVVTITEIVGEKDPRISIHAMVGNPTSNTRHLLGRINGVFAVILIESSSTHNFLDSIVAKRAKIKSDTTPKLIVKIANGDIV